MMWDLPRQDPVAVTPGGIAVRVRSCGPRRFLADLRSESPYARRTFWGAEGTFSDAGELIRLVIAVDHDGLGFDVEIDCEAITNETNLMVVNPLHAFATAWAHVACCFGELFGVGGPWSGMPSEEQMVRALGWAEDFIRIEAQCGGSQ